MKLAELTFLRDNLPQDKDATILIIGECGRNDHEKVSESIYENGYNNVTTTDIAPRTTDSWLDKNTSWPHITTDFINFKEEEKYDALVSVSVFEHFGFHFGGTQCFEGSNSIVKWNHDLKGMMKSASLLKDKSSRVIITLPLGPYYNYDKETAYPFLRYYDNTRRDFITRELKKENILIGDEVFVHTSNCKDFTHHRAEEIFSSQMLYRGMDPNSPNAGWFFTLRKG